MHAARRLAKRCPDAGVAGEADWAATLYGDSIVFKRLREWLVGRPDETPAEQDTYPVETDEQEESAELDGALVDAADAADTEHERAATAVSTAEPVPPAPIIPPSRAPAPVTRPAVDAR